MAVWRGEGHISKISHVSRIRGIRGKNKSIIMQTRCGISQNRTQKVPQVSQKTIKGTKNHNDSHIPVGARLYPFRRAWRGAAHETIVRTGLSWTWNTHPPRLKRLRQKHSKALDRILKELKRNRLVLPDQDPGGTVKVGGE